jgi:drug/metabolite transporter (DMT)-like permease
MHPPDAAPRGWPSPRSVRLLSLRLVGARRVFIINTSPVFCVLMDRFVLKEALPLRTIVMVVLGITGVLVILLDDILFSKEAVGQAEEEQARNTTLGNFICLLNPISWSFCARTVLTAASLPRSLVPT